MLNGTLLAGFIIAALVVLLIPGPGVMHIIARSVSQGQRAGVLSALGLAAGALVHVAAATLGISAILVTSATAFGIVKLLGAGYLVYLGISTLVSGRRIAEPSAAASRSSYRLFVDGVIISTFNPKIAIFFLAFLPQFADPSCGPIAQQVLLLGLVYVGLAIVTDSSYALLAGSVKQWFSGKLMQGPLPRYVSGSIYLGLGISAALLERR